MFPLTPFREHSVSDPQASTVTPRKAFRFKRAVMTGMAGLLIPIVSSASSINIANAPLSLNPSIEPNVMFILDDSGSMQWEHMPDETMRFTIFVFPRPALPYGGPNEYDNQVPDFLDNNRHNVFSRSAANNAVFYNPLITYSPWVDAANNPMDDADPSAAPYNPVDATRGTLNLTAEQTQSAYWFRNTTNSNPSSAQYSCSVPCNQTFWPITFYQYKGTGDRFNTSNYVKYQIRGASAYTRDLAAGSESALTSFVWSDGDQTITRTVLEERQNFANWFTYYRSRILASRAGIGAAFARQPEEMRVGFGTINTGARTIDGVTSNRAILTGVRTFAGASRADFFDRLYNHSISNSGTPLRRALQGAGQYYERSDNRGPWGRTPGTNDTSAHLECRQSYTILMTDGYWNGATPSVGNSDNEAGSLITNHAPGGTDFQYSPTTPFRDTHSDTLADVAMHFWKRDLRTDLDNLVPVSSINPAFWQHMVTFGVGLGVTGSVSPQQAFAAINNPDITITWPDPSDSNPAKLDDLLHAGVNSRGGFFSAADPTTFANELAGVLDNIIARAESSATSAAASSAVLQDDTLLYSAGFRSTDWSGTLTARRLEADGSVSPPDCADCWDAEERLSVRNPATRNIFTRAATGPGAGGGVQFTWGNLHANQRAALDRAPDNTVDGLGAARAAWLRGIEHDDLRSRARPAAEGTGSVIRRLGDIIHSDPVFADGVIYVGANDGKLHAFDAATGEELFAYIPSPLLLPEPGRDHAPLSRLMDKDYAHRYFMDGKLSVSRVTIGGTPRTVLVGTMGAGGRTLFALDVTNPHNFSASNVLWEFSHNELGYLSGHPAVARTSNGTWAVFAGNGYNSQSEKAALFVVNLATGSLIQLVTAELSGSPPANGLSSPFVTDWPDRNLRVNTVYAGDLLGNLWAFNLSSTNTNQWTNTGNRRILAQARDPGGLAQPITSRPHGAMLENGDVMITFGTGSYFRTSDGSDTQVQTLYGIIDQKTPAATPHLRANLLQQSIILQQTHAFGDQTYTIRVVSDNEFDSSAHHGWYLDLDQEIGERVITGPQSLGASEQRVRFSTMVPDDNPCSTGVRGFLMDMDLLTGGRTQAPVFDLDQDGLFDEGDMIQIVVDGDPVYVPITGIEHGEGERIIGIRVPDPGEVCDEDGENCVPRDPCELLCDGEGNCECGRPGDDETGGRISWRELR